METKEFKIEVPEGFVIDTDNSDLTKGIVKFKKVDNKPRSWEEFCEKNPLKTGKTGEAFIEHDSCISILTNNCRHNRISRYDKNLCTSVAEAEAFLALMQLRQLRKAWIGNWEPNHGPIIDDNRYAIKYNFRDNWVVNVASIWCNHVMLFPTKKMAEEFLECFKDLLEKAKILL